MLGASFDTPAENLAFAEAQGFDYPLLCDVDHSVGALFEVVRPSGHRFADYPERISYLIDREGVIRHAYEVTAVADHAATVLHDIAELEPRPG